MADTKPESEMTAEELREKYDRPNGRWGEHSDHIMDDWREEVASEDTRLGYWEWVVHKIEEAKGDED